MSRTAVASLAFALLCSLAIGGCSSFEPGRRAPQGPQAVDGILDLRAWNFVRQGAVSLGGEWHFAPAAFLGSASAEAYKGWVRRRVPDFWRGKAGELGGDLPGTGYGTYHLRILLPPGGPFLAVRNFSGFNAFELETSGVVIAGAGHPAADRASSVEAYAPGVNQIPAWAIHPGGIGDTKSNEVELFFRTSDWNYRGGGIWKVLILGEASTLMADQRRDGNFQIFLAATMAALGANSLIIFASRRKEKSYFFFGLLSLIIALRPLVTGEYLLTNLLPGIGFDLLVRLEYATAMLAVPAVIAFFLSFFPRGKPWLWSILLVGPFVPFWVFILVLPLYWLTWTIFAFYAVAVVEIAASAALAGAAYRRTQGGLTMFVGGCLLALSGVNDVLYSSHIIATATLFPIALVLFIFLQSSVLARRLTSAFERVEILSKDLADSNGMLKDQICAAVEASARLEESLAEKEVLLKEVHHRVKNSLQIVSSIAALQANRTEDSAAAELARSIRERIRVISLANEKLYDVDSGDRIDLVDYARDVLDLAVSSYDSEDCRIEAELLGDRVPADPAMAIDFGLVLTELVVNSLKHALLPKGGGCVSVSVVGSEGLCTLEVRDDGPGFPESFDPASARSLGFKIIMALLKRRRGSIGLSKGPGPTITCSMRLTSNLAVPPHKTVFGPSTRDQQA